MHWSTKIPPLVIIIHLLILANYPALEWLTKPLILLSILLGYTLGSTQKNKYVLLAFAASLVGDVLLLFDEQYEWCFIAGLASFLSAHVAFTVAFFKAKNQAMRFSLWYLVLAAIAYPVYYLLQQVQLNQPDLFFPVMAYVAAIVSTFIGAVVVQNQFSKSWYAVAGALYFIASDYALGYNKFVAAIPMSSLLIMSTYAVAQYLLMLSFINIQTAKKVV